MSPRFYADLHIHSKYSRATSREGDLPHLAHWARKKGIAVLGTGDFTHPAWLAALEDELVEAEPGLYRLRDDLQRQVDSWSGAATAAGPTRFMLQVEISTIYKKDERTRKVHHLIYVPSLEAARRLVASLSRIGNLTADGRPILGLDSRDLLEITLETSPDAFLIPAHIWTPWFAALGSKSGFDSIDHCYADLADQIFAVETGLSSDPPMNWRLSALDRYTLVSNSDAHSPAKLGREACCFDGTAEPSYHAILAALRTREGFAGTVEMFPEEGKYHLDGHRKCQVRLEPGQTRERDGLCPVCGRPVTVGVMHRIEDLADRAEDPPRPARAAPFRSLIPLCEVLAEIEGVGAGSRRVTRAYEGLLTRVGAELEILERIPHEDLRRGAGPLVAEAIERMRAGRVERTAGYDGEYGVIRLFEPGEVERRKSDTLFAFDPPSPSRGAPTFTPAAPCPTSAAGDAPTSTVLGKAPGDAADPPAVGQTLTLFGPSAEGGDLLAALDPDQRRAAEVAGGPLLIVAGPGTGKTRTLTHRIAHRVTGGTPASSVLAITFTRRAADELRGRLSTLLPTSWRAIQVSTFHALAWAMLREHATRVGLLSATPEIADQTRQHELLTDALGLSARATDRLLGQISRAKRTATALDPESELGRGSATLAAALAARGLVDLDDLIGLAVRLLEEHPAVCRGYRDRYRTISIDEFQDVDAQQYRLVRLLAPPDERPDLCAIGDPDQAIYGFRGADPSFFLSFERDYPGARAVRLTRNYRSTEPIVESALQVIAAGPASSSNPLLTRRELRPMRGPGSPLLLHEAPTEAAEAEYVVQAVERLIGGHTFFSLDSGRSGGDGEAELSFGDLAVLYRTEAQAAALVEALARSGIPFQQRSHHRLVERPLLAWLVQHLRQQDGALPDQLARLRDQAGATLDLAPDDTDAVFTWLDALAGDCEHRLPRFIAQLALGSEADSWDPRADRVSLLTLHAAKGLEFPVVFLVGCDDGLLPLRFGPADAEEDDPEERRLMFVGMTRARQRLLLTRARKRRVRGKVRETAPSPYLAEIASSLLEADQPAGPKRRRDPQLSLL